MLTTLGIVQPRLWSDTPLDKPGQGLTGQGLTGQGLWARRLGGKSLLEWVVRRATECQQLDRVIVALGSGPEEKFLGELVPRDVPLFIGSPRDVLGRYVAALAEHPAEAVVRISADAPFVDPVLIDRLVTTAAEHPTCDYIGYASRDGRPAILSSVGLFAEWCRADALRAAHAAAKDSSDRELPTRYLYTHPEKFNIRLLAAPPGLDAGDVRLQIDSDEDWEHVETIFEALGPDALDWQKIAGLLEQQPNLRSRMATLNRRPSKAL